MINNDQPNIIPVYSIAEKNESAMTLQKYIRGHLVRESLLPSDQYPQYLAQCQEANFHTTPRALDGKTAVFLPPKMPEVVLKQSGKSEAIKRFHQMQEVRAILNSQNSSHLIIPKATLCQDFLIEQRLPINTDPYHNMELYLSQPELFDEAVRELTRLFSKRYLDDLIDIQRFFKNTKVDDFVRYDNLPLFISEEEGKKEGKIGLIDLEHIQNRPSYKGLRTLARIFPYQLEIIKEEAKKLKSEFYEAALESAAQEGKKYLKVEFSDHLDWLKQKEISNNIDHQSFEISPQRANELTKVIEEELLKINQGNYSSIRKNHIDETEKKFISNEPEGVAKELAEDISSKLIHDLKTFLKKDRNKKISRLSKQQLTESELVSLRSAIISRLELYLEVAHLILENKGIKFEKDASFQARSIAEQLTIVFLESLDKNRDIFFFDPGISSYGSHNSCWIRY